MDAGEIEARLKQLSSIVGKLEMSNLFNVKYAELLGDINKLSVRFALLLRLRIIGEMQCRYLKGEMKQEAKDETGGVMQ